MNRRYTWLYFAKGSCSKILLNLFLNLDNEIQNRLVLLSIKRATDDTAVFKYFVDEKSLCAS